MIVTNHLLHLVRLRLLIGLRISWKKIDHRSTYSTQYNIFYHIWVTQLQLLVPNIDSFIHPSVTIKIYENISSFRDWVMWNENIYFAPFVIKNCDWNPKHLSIDVCKLTLIISQFTAVIYLIVIRVVNVESIKFNNKEGTDNYILGLITPTIGILQHFF